MIVQGERARLRNSALGIVAGTLVLTGCAANNFNGDENDASRLMNKLYQEQEVRKCLGSAALVIGGHVRTTPDTSYDDYIVNNYQSLDTVVTNPEQIHLPGHIDGVSNTWYVTRLANGQNGFINQVALVNPGALDCTSVALPSTPLGSIRTTNK